MGRAEGWSEGSSRARARGRALTRLFIYTRPPAVRAATGETTYLAVRIYAKSVFALHARVNRALGQRGHLDVRTSPPYTRVNSANRRSRWSEIGLYPLRCRNRNGRAGARTGGRW